MMPMSRKVNDVIFCPLTSRELTLKQKWWSVVAGGLLYEVTTRTGQIDRSNQGDSHNLRRPDTPPSGFSQTLPWPGQVVILTP